MLGEEVSRQGGRKKGGIHVYAGVEDCFTFLPLTGLYSSADHHLSASLEKQAEIRNHFRVSHLNVSKKRVFSYGARPNTALQHHQCHSALDTNKSRWEKWVPLEGFDPSSYY